MRQEQEKEQRTTIRGVQLQNLLEDLLSGTQVGAVQRKIDQYQDNAIFEFHGIDWQKLRDLHTDKSLHLPKVRWGKNLLVFNDCDFGDGNLTLAGSFEGGIRFNNVRFGPGIVSFADSTFSNLYLNGAFEGEGEIIFCGCIFLGETGLKLSSIGSKHLNFSPITEMHSFKHRPCEFHGEVFDLNVKSAHGSTISFPRASFQTDYVFMEFSDEAHLARVLFFFTEWGSQFVEIKGMQIDSGEAPLIQFGDADFERVGKLRFQDIGTTHGYIGFDYVTFPKHGHTSFSFSDLGKGSVTFIQAHCANSIEFFQGPGRRFDAEFSLRGSTFEGPLRIDGIRFGPVPSLIGTELRKHLDLSNVTFGVMMSESDKKTEDDRGAKLQRLKELAEGNRDHNLALKCHAEEMQWNRFRGGKKSWPAGILDVAFQVTSNYGQSIARPFWWLFVTWIGFGFLYRASVECIDHPWLFSFSWLLPFLPASSVLRDNGFDSIFADASTSLYLLAGFQGLISFSLIFLIGLGFRNRFRI